MQQNTFFKTIDGQTFDAKYLIKEITENNSPQYLVNNLFKVKDLLFNLLAENDGFDEKSIKEAHHVVSIFCNALLSGQVNNKPDQA